MTEGDATIKLAVELLQVPSRVRFARTQPLPPSLLQLLLAAAGDEKATLDAAHTLERPDHVVREAARFFIEQVLLAPESDNYRILGATPAATTIELRRNMALLLRSLHPDVEHAGRSVFAQRVTGAWDQLKTPERRAAYDRQMKSDARPQRKTRRPRFTRQRRRPNLRERLAAIFGMTKP